MKLTKRKGFTDIKTYKPKPKVGPKAPQFAKKKGKVDRAMEWLL